MARRQVQKKERKKEKFVFSSLITLLLQNFRSSSSGATMAKAGRRFALPVYLCRWRSNWFRTLGCGSTNARCELLKSRVNKRIPRANNAPRIRGPGVRWGNAVGWNLLRGWNSIYVGPLVSMGIPGSGKQGSMRHWRFL